MKKYSRIMNSLIAIAALIFHVNAYAEHSEAEPQIIGGGPVPHSSVPYQVALTVYGQQFCGGTLIAPNWVLTAAHCVDSYAANRLQIRIGASDLRTSEGEKHNVAAKYVHEGWNGNLNNGGDIALLRLSSNVSATYTPARLPTPAIKSSLASPGAKLKASGWGRTVGDKKGGTPILQATDLTVVSRAECPRVMRIPVSSHYICGYEPTSVICNGDSGGPWVANSNDGNFVFGVASWVAEGCITASAFTDVTQYVPWITRISGIEAGNGGASSPNPPADNVCSSTPNWDQYKQYSAGNKVLVNGVVFSANRDNWGIHPYRDYWGTWTVERTCNP